MLPIGNRGKKTGRSVITISIDYLADSFSSSKEVLAVTLTSTTNTNSSKLFAFRARLFVTLMVLLIIVAGGSTYATDYPALPQAINSFGAAVSGDSLYVYGGHAHDPHVYSKETLADGFYRLNLKTRKQWESLAFDRPLQGLAIVAHGEFIYRVGGMAGRNEHGEDADLFSTNSFARYNPKTNTWTELTPLPEPRSSHDAVVVGDRVYVIGGWALNGKDAEATWHPTAWYADLTQATIKWEVMPNPPFMRRALAAAGTNGRLYAIGGIESEGGLSRKVDIFDLKANQWIDAADVPVRGHMKAFGAAAIGSGDAVYINAFDGRVYSMTDDNDSWQRSKSKLPTSRFFHRMATVDDRLLFIAGSKRGARLNSIVDVDVKTFMDGNDDQSSAKASSRGQTQWPGFRGTGSSRSDAANLPVRWSADQNVAWELDLDGYGQSSPIVWDGSVYVTCVKGDMKERNLIHCVDLKSGKVKWTKSFDSSHQAKATRYISKSAPTPVADAAGVVAFFESGDLIALNHAGDLRWQRSLTTEYGEFQGNHGVGCSLAQTDDSIIVLIDHSGPSYLLSVDKVNGKNRWKMDREQRVSWSSPLVFKDGDESRIIVSSNGIVESIAAADGTRSWFVDGLEGNTVPSASVSDDIVVVGSSKPDSCIAIRRGGRGDVGGSHKLWVSESASNTFSSPLIHRGGVWFVNRAGEAKCLDLETGKQVVTIDVATSCWATPIAAGDRIYFFNKAGGTFVVQLGEGDHKVISTNMLPTEDPVYGAAAVDGAFVIRMERKLMCVGKP